VGIYKRLIGTRVVYLPYMTTTRTSRSMSTIYRLAIIKIVTSSYCRIRRNGIAAY
jgi:hypothetical protein